MNKTQVVIIDTNVVIAGLITSQVDSSTAKILDGMLNGQLIYLLSPALLKEYREVLLRPKLVRLHGLSEDEIDQILTDITANGIWHEPPSIPGLKAPDPGDNHLWSLLASEPASILVTGDQLLIQNPKPKSSVISPATFIKGFYSKSEGSTFS